jgi:hypothetical protein
MPKSVTLLSISLIANSFFFKYNLSLRAGNDSLKQEINKEKNGFKSETNTVLKFLKTNLENSISSQDKKCENIQLTKSNGEKVLLSDIIKGSKKLIFYFKKINCQVCIEDELEALKEYANRNGKENIILLTEFERLKHQLIFEKKYKLNTYNLSGGSLSLQIEKLNAPFYVTIDENLIANNIFQPTKIIPESTSIYLENLTLCN